MRITVKLYATLHQYSRGKKAGLPFEIELSENASVQSLIEYLKIPPGETRITFVNGIIREADYRLNEGDVVGLFPPIGGG